MIFELYLELSYFLSQIYIVITVTEVTFSSQVPHLKVTGTGAKFLFKNNFPIPVSKLSRRCNGGLVFLLVGRALDALIVDVQLVEVVVGGGRRLESSKYL